MVIRIGNKKLEHYNQVAVTLKYDSVASGFSFNVYFDPDNADHKEMFLPGRFPECVIEYEGQTLITGYLIGYKFKSNPNQDNLLNINGYSKTGFLEDCEIPISAYPLQGDNINLKEKTEKILKPFGLKLIVDQSVNSKCSSNYKNTTGGDTQTCKSYISELASQKNVIVTHDEKGNLVFTEAKATAKPIFDFEQGMPGVEYELDFDGQKMHSVINVQKQANKKRGTNKAKADVSNPYCEVFRPAVARQSSGNDNTTKDAARNMLGEELKAISVTITLQGWLLNGEIVRPNQIVTILNKQLYIYKKTNFFIESVTFNGGGDGVNDTAVLTCVPPESYSSETPKNIFK